MVFCRGVKANQARVLGIGEVELSLAEAAVAAARKFHASRR